MIFFPGWSTSSSLSQERAITALQRAIRDRKPGPGLIHHSDRGIQYASYDYQAILNGHGFFPSMSGKGNCYDNACIESFFKTLKSELVYHEKYITRQEAKNSLFDSIEGFYNRRRIHSTLGYNSPEQFEKKSRVASLCLYFIGGGLKFSFLNLKREQRNLTVISRSILFPSMNNRCSLNQ